MSKIGPFIYFTLPCSPFRCPDLQQRTQHPALIPSSWSLCPSSPAVKRCLGPAGHWMPRSTGNTWEIWGKMVWETPSWTSCLETLCKTLWRHSGLFFADTLFCGYTLALLEVVWRFWARVPVSVVEGTQFLSPVGVPLLNPMISHEDVFRQGETSQVYLADRCQVFRSVQKHMQKLWKMEQRKALVPWNAR